MSFFREVGTDGYDSDALKYDIPDINYTFTDEELEREGMYWYNAYFRRKVDIHDKTRLNEFLLSKEKDLNHDLERFNDIAQNGAKAMSDYDINIASGGDAIGAVTTALGLKSSHIWNNKVSVEFAKKHLNKGQVSLF